MPNLTKHLVYLIFLAGLAWLALWIADGAHAETNPSETPIITQDPVTPIIDSDALSSAQSLDRLQMDLHRVAELAKVLSQITQALPPITPYVKSIQILLDDTLPPQRRWRQALDQLPPSAENLQDKATDEATERLLVELSALRDELQTISSNESGRVSPREHTADESSPWTFESSSVRYAQMATEEKGPEVWLQAPSKHAWVRLGETVVLEGIRVRLVALQPQPGGHYRLRFVVDGEPVTFDW